MKSFAETSDRRFPGWMKRAIPAAGRSAAVGRLLRDLKLETVCIAAQCPSRSECFARGTATFMILGRTCTRNCRFCAVPRGRPAPPRAEEPEAVGEAAMRLSLRHVVVTSVTRDDLPDGGAGHFARTIRAVRRRLRGATIEVLTPDFLGDTAAIDTVLAARPDVFNHNIETAARLYPAVRPDADYRRSLGVLARAADRAMPVKSGIMLGLGESPAEIGRALADLREVQVTILTIGQYLAPSPQHAPVVRFVPPAEFEAWKSLAVETGFTAVAAGPYVRSSYQAEKLFQAACKSRPELQDRRRPAFTL